MVGISESFSQFFFNPPSVGIIKRHPVQLLIYSKKQEYLVLNKTNSERKKCVV